MLPSLHNHRKFHFPSVGKINLFGVEYIYILTSTPCPRLDTIIVHGQSWILQEHPVLISSLMLDVGIGLGKQS